MRRAPTYPRARRRRSRRTTRVVGSPHPRPSRCSRAAGASVPAIRRWRLPPLSRPPRRPASPRQTKQRPRSISFQWSRPVSAEVSRRRLSGPRREALHSRQRVLRPVREAPPAAPWRLPRWVPGRLFALLRLTAEDGSMAMRAVPMSRRQVLRLPRWRKLSCELMPPRQSDASALSPSLASAPAGAGPAPSEIACRQVSSLRASIACASSTR